jgi:asparagine synthase (glutamine-hydrolysing)
MSAIFGIVRWDGAQADGALLQGMQRELIRYGLSEQGFQLNAGAGFGGCVSKLGPFEQADVPVLTDDRMGGLTLVADARIYNRDELARDHGLESGEGVSTQALLLQAYLRWGEDFPKYINGDFAAAIWDEQLKRLLLARDHTGVRPLYYFCSQAVFAFATDYRALLQLPFVAAEPDEVKLYAMMTNTYRSDVESTFFAAIRKLPQARTMRVEADGRTLRKYWTPARGKKTRCQTEAEYAGAMMDIVTDAVRRRVQYYAGEKLGAELSGGQDSSVVTVLLSRELKQAGQSPAVYSWSPPFDQCKLQVRDERIMVELICRQEGLTVQYDDPRQPVPFETRYSPMITDHVCSEALFRELPCMQSQGVRAVFTGWGGDQAISHRANMFSLLLSGHWGCYLREAWREGNGSAVKFAKSIIGNAVFPLFAPFSVFSSVNRNLPTLVNPSFAKRMKRRCKRSVLLFKVNPIKHFDSPDIPSRTEMTSWVGAEYNVQFLFPFLDYRVVDFALSIPRHLYYKNGTSRYIYRKASCAIPTRTAPRMNCEATAPVRGSGRRLPTLC